MALPAANPPRTPPPRQAGGESIVWFPKYDFGEGGGEKLEIGLDPTGEIPWKVAPFTSHLERFRLFDLRNPLVQAIPRIREDGRSEIHIQYKAKSGHVVATYIYRFVDHDEAEEIYLEMWGHESPGKVVWARMTRMGIPYQRIS